MTLVSLPYSSSLSSHIAKQPDLPSLRRLLAMVEYLKSRDEQRMNWSLKRKMEVFAGRRRCYHEHTAHTKPASGHQILCARHIGHFDLPPSPGRLTPSESGASLHAPLCSSGLRQDHPTLYLGTITLCKPFPGGLGVSGRLY